MWRSRIFWRLFLAYSVLLTVSLASLGWILVQRIEKHTLAELQRSLVSKTLLVQELVAHKPKKELQALMARVANDRTRVTLIAGDGTVLAESTRSADELENHRDRVEVHLAEKESSGLGMATRYSTTTGQPMMYVARRSDTPPARYVRMSLSISDVNDEVRWLRRLVWTGVGVTLLLALGLSLVIARRITNPLVELSGTANTIAVSGEYGTKVPVASTDEVGTLAASFNAMSQACAVHIAQMDQDRQQLRAVFRSMVEGVLVLDADQNIQFLNEAAGQMLGVTHEGARGRKIWQLFRHRQLGEMVQRVMSSEEPCRGELEWNVSDRKVFAIHGACLPGEPLRGAVLVFHDVTHLRKLERVRQDFVANVSHELKTPLAAIQATVETLLDGAMQDPEYGVRFLERIGENADRLHRLVHDLLTLGRIEAGQEVLQLESLPLVGAVEASMSRQAERARTKNLRLVAEPPAQPVFVRADDEALAEILDNLLDNAIKYTPAGGAITFRWSADNKEAELHVKDTGVGIPEKDLPRIFERFYRADKARSRELGGTGLGLSIVKHLVQSLGGSITATSEVGVGSTFSVRLPVAAPEASRNGQRPRVVFVCVENSNRSQMAEAFARMHGEGLVEAFSAGSRPSGIVNPRAIEAMREVGYDLTRHQSKSVSGLPAGEFDVAVTMGCGDQCPALRARVREDWQIPDPKAMPPEQFRAVRDLIESKVKELLGKMARRSSTGERELQPTLH